jgi:hypothetical protein
VRTRGKSVLLALKGLIAIPVGHDGIVNPFEAWIHWPARTHAHRIDKKASCANSNKVRSKDPSGRDQLTRDAASWRRRRNRPGNAQAHGPLGDDTLESDFPLNMENPPKEVTSFETDCRAKEIFQVSGQRGQGAAALVVLHMPPLWSRRVF